MEDANDLANAKARLIQTAAQVDLLGPVRKHPILSVAIAGATGAFLGASTENIAGATALSGSLASLVRAGLAAIDRFGTPPAATASTATAPKSPPNPAQA